MEFFGTAMLVSFFNFVGDALWGIGFLALFVVIAGVVWLVGRIASLFAKKEKK